MTILQLEVESDFLSLTVAPLIIYLIVILCLYIMSYMCQIFLRIYYQCPNFLKIMITILFLPFLVSMWRKTKWGRSSSVEWPVMVCTPSIWTHATRINQSLLCQHLVLASLALSSITGWDILHTRFSNNLRHLFLFVGSPSLSCMYYLSNGEMIKVSI